MQKYLQEQNNFKMKKKTNMKNNLKFIMPFLFAMLGTIVFIHAVFTCQFDVALPSMIFASFWILLLTKIK